MLDASYYGVSWLLEVKKKSLSYEEVVGIQSLWIDVASNTVLPRFNSLFTVDRYECQLDFDK